MNDRFSYIISNSFSEAAGISAGNVSALKKRGIIKTPTTERMVCNPTTIGGKIGACCHGEDIIGLWTTSEKCSTGTA